jgi:tetratricopeptide (TPR) repeat protein
VFEMKNDLRGFSKQFSPHLLRLLLFLVICGLVIAPALNGEFLQWDDDKNLYKNPWLLENNALKFWTERYYFLLYIPVTYTLWTWLWHISNDSLVFHLFSLFLHALNCNWVFVITRRLCPELESKYIWLVALAFAIMPLQIEAFAWVSGGRDLLGLQFSLAGIYVFLMSTNPLALAGSVLLFALGLLSKPTVAPLVIAILAFKPVRDCLTRSRVITLLIWLGLAIADLAWNRSVQDIGLDANVANIPLEQRLLVTIDALGFYAKQIVWPLTLSADYARTPWRVLGEQMYWPTLVYMLLTLAALGLIQWRYKIRSVEFAAFFLIGMSPVLGTIPFMAQAQSTVADRYVYWPWIGLAIFLGLLAKKFKYGFETFAVVLVFWSAVSFARSFAWQSDDRLFTDMLQKQPSSFTANNALGAFAFQNHDFEKAEVYFKKAREMMPHRAGVASNLAQLYYVVGKKDQLLAEFLPLLNDTSWVTQNGPEYIPLSVIYLVVGRVQKEKKQYEAANLNLCRSYGLNPDNFSARLEIERSLSEIQNATGKVINCLHR